ncbi:MAG: Ig-like domain-containing protein [Planctomycetes bacterium]|nr:Ig-like domain-containing protein [Planctomycetota bacterium]
MKAIKTRRHKTMLQVEPLEDRTNPGIIIVTPGAQHGLLELSGPGLNNSGGYTLTNYGVREPNNDDTPFKQNFWSQNIIFGTTGYIDTVFRVQNSNGSSEFRFEGGDLHNRTGITWNRFKVSLGFGTGASFTPMPSSFLGNSLDMDSPDFTMMNPDADPGVGFRVMGGNGANVTGRFQEETWLQFTATWPTNGFATLWYNVDVPEWNAPHIPFGQRLFGPDGFQFTIRWQPFRTPMPGNAAPMGMTDNYSVLSGQTLTVSSPGVLGNDFDPENDPLTAELIQFPSHGALYFHTDGSFSYTPDPGFVGTDEFVYQAYDGNEFSSNVSVYISVMATSSEQGASLGGQASISGLAWKDANGNGIQEIGESAFAGLIVELRNSFGQFVGSAITDSGGNYQFTNVAEGIYYLVFVKPSGYGFTVQDQGSDDSVDSDINLDGLTAFFSLYGSESKDFDAGLVPTTP